MLNCGAVTHCRNGLRCFTQGLAMNAKLTNNTFLPLSAMIARLRASPKLVLAFTIAIVITLSMATFFWAKSPDYRVVFSQVSDEDGGAIINELTKLNVPYRFEQQGGAIMVPADNVHEVRLKLAQLGLPKGGAVGFELLDQEKFGISQFSEQINYQRALEGELSRTIESLGPVRAARVHLAIPKPSMFLHEQTPPSAAVTVTLNSGRTLDEAQVSAITHLISSAVPSLQADQVTVVDQRGKLLTQNGSQAVQTSQRQFTQDIEADYQQRIQKILAPLVGNNNVRAQVTAQLDFTTLEQTNEQYQPNSSPEKMTVRSRQSSHAEQGNGQPVGGVPGALSNQPPEPVSMQINQPSVKGGKNSDKSDTSGGLSTVLPPQPYNNRNDDTTNYEVDRMLTHTRSNAARIERLSAAVVVNYLPVNDGDKESGALNEAQLAQITALVKEAVGYSASRGDSVNIVNSPFSAQDDDVPLPFWQEPAFLNMLIAASRYLLAAIVIWLMWRKGIKPALQRYQNAQNQQLAQEKQALHEQATAAQRQTEQDEQQKTAQRVETEITTQQLRDMAQQEPRVIALVIRQWMNKERTPS